MNDSEINEFEKKIKDSRKYCCFSLRSQIFIVRKYNRVVAPYGFYGEFDISIIGKKSKGFDRKQWIRFRKFGGKIDRKQLELVLIILQTVMQKKVSIKSRC